MNEEQAVLDFFAKMENLTLGLSVAEQIDTIRIELNSGFWRALQQRLFSQLNHDLFDSKLAQWQIEMTEDRNAEGVLVGLHCRLSSSQPIYLMPMLEQQFLGGTWRIFYGLMWNSAATPEQLKLPVIASLKQTLQDAGFKNNENFLAWQWSNFYPRRRDFILKQAHHPEELLDEVQVVFNKLLSTHQQLINEANAVLNSAPRSIPISLTQLHRK